MHALKPLAFSLPAGEARAESWLVPFGGSYQEHWSADYALTIRYRDRRTVRAVWDGARWQAAEGDADIIEQLSAPDCPVLTQAYFQTAAAVQSAVARCEACGLQLDRLRECADFGDDPLAAAELMRLLMDERGFPLDGAFQVAAECCADLRAVGVEVEKLYALQPRLAHVISLLRGCSRNMLALRHDALDERYRSPLGAVREETPLRLSLQVLAGTVERAWLILQGDALRQELPMRREGDCYVCSISAPARAAALWYSFRVETGSSAHWLCPDESGSRGRLYGYEAPGFRLTVYRRDFETPAWFRRSVMYQIFPDRFAFSDDDTARRGLDYHRSLGQTPELHESLDEPPRWQPRPFERAYSPDDFYGGTLRGILGKLGYLQELGVSCLYLNPIVEARSNHRYDSSDYLRVDPILGSNEDFEELCRAAETKGIRLILDGVFSHTGADSVYFNRWGHYPERGACQGQDSPYYGWYDFQSYPDRYSCWWGFKDLPEVDENDEAWQAFIIRGQDSVVKTWLRRGAAGWRLDVADELPDAVLALIRRAAKEEKGDALILGEVWEDAVIKESYGARRNYALGHSLDTVMNYPLRTALLNFMRGYIDACGLRDFLLSQQLNYPAPFYYSLMDLLGSHDVERLRSALATDRQIKAYPREEQLQIPFSDASLEKAVELEKLLATIQFALPGVPSIYYGDEQGMCGVGDPFNRLPFREERQDLHDHYAALAALRNSAPALSTGHARFLAASGGVLLVLRYILDGRDVFGESAENGVYLAVASRDEEPADYTIDCSDLGCGIVTGHIGACSAEVRRLL